MAGGKIFFWGLLISFLGTLPFSSLNITAMQISLQEGVAQAMCFSIGTLLTEIILVRIALIGFNWMRKQTILFKWFEWITFSIILLFAIGSFIAAAGSHRSGNVLLNSHVNRFWLGMFMSLVTPAHIPFWFAWSTVLFTKGILKPTPLFYNIYIIGIGLGTFLANCIFIYGGKLIEAKLNANQQLLNWSIGFIFLITAVIQLIKNLRVRKKAPTDFNR